MLMTTEKIQGREDSRDCNERQAGEPTTGVTTRICELVGQAERMRGADNRQPGHRKDKNFKGAKGMGLEFPQFTKLFIKLKVRRQGCICRDRANWERVTYKPFNFCSTSIYSNKIFPFLSVKAVLRSLESSVQKF